MDDLEGTPPIFGFPSIFSHDDDSRFLAVVFFLATRFPSVHKREFHHKGPPRGRAKSNSPQNSSSLNGLTTKTEPRDSNPFGPLRSMSHPGWLILLMEEIPNTTWGVCNLVENWIFSISTGAEFLPSTVGILKLDYYPTLLGSIITFCCWRTLRPGPTGTLSQLRAKKKVIV